MNEKGQTLIIIILLMIVALSIGVGISSRFIKRLHTTVQTDLSSKSQAVADAALEHILNIPATTLETYATNGTCGTDCFLQITGADNVTTSANVVLSRLGNSSDPFLVDVTTTDTSQVSLQGYTTNQPVRVCWQDNTLAVSAIYIYGTQGSYSADSYAYNSAGLSQSNGFSTASPYGGYANCFSFTAKANSVLLRIKSYYANGVVAVLPATGVTLPTQGILAESTGTAGDAVRKVSVIITDPILPSIFDFALYQTSTTETLSN